MLADIRFSETEISRFARHHHIKRLAFFGSVLRKDFRPDSDVDVLIEFEVGHKPGLMGFVKIQQELSELMGRNIDLRTSASLSEYFRENVLSEAATFYEHV